MQKASPIFLVLILAITAGIFSIHSRRQAFPTKAPEELTISNPPSEEASGVPESESAASGTSAVTPVPWPQASSDIAPDAGATFGTLENGFRYIIYPNAEPPKRVSLRLHIASGSLMEADDQQGLSHFLEHMVFNGSKDFTSEELVPKMQRLGIGFGAHVNAYTSFDETVYMLDLPDLSPETLKLGFTVMRDFGDGALLAADEIEKERGVILSEKVSRDTVESRIMEKEYSKLLPDSLIARRFPIGIEEVIKNAPRERFADLYSRYYIPARMTFVVVGDINAKEMETTIKETFSSMTNPAEPVIKPDLGPIRQPEGIVTSVFADKELSSTDVSLMLVRPDPEKPDTTENRAADMTLDIAQSILTRRFQRLSKVEGSPIASGSATNNDAFNYMEIGSIDVTAADDRWQEAVPVMEQEFRRALQFGFTEAELAEAKSNLLNAYQQRVRQKATRKSESIASALATASNESKVFSDPETDLALASKALDTIDLKAVHEAFSKFWGASGYDLVLVTKNKPENAEKDLAAIFEESRTKPVEPLTARVLAPFGYTDFGKAGTVASRKVVKDIGLTQFVLSNQVRVNLKPTDFEKGKIRLIARIGSGKLTQPKNMPMLDMFANAIFEGGGLGKHSNDDLQEILAGKNVSSSFSVGEDAFTLGGTTTPVDFTTEVRLLCANLTDPGYRTEGLWQFQKAIPMIFQQLKHTPAGPQQEMEAWLHGGDSRYAVATQEKLSSYTLEDAKKWLTPELTKGYLELSIVGDFEIEKILPDLLATFGALPKRAATAPALTEARTVKFPIAPASKTFTYDSKIPQASAIAIWKILGIRGNTKDFRRFNILASIYGDRLREEIREKLGASYSPNAGASGSDALEGMGYVIGESVGKPEDLELLLKTMLDLAATFSANGATDDELDRALKPVLSQLGKSLRDNKYWLEAVLSQSQSEPQRLDLARGRDADYKSISLKEVNAFAKKYLGAENALLISIKPAE